MEIDQNTPHRVHLNPGKRKRGPQGTAKNRSKQARSSAPPRRIPRKALAPRTRGRKPRVRKKEKRRREEERLQPEVEVTQVAAAVLAPQIQLANQDLLRAAPSPED